MDPSEYDDDVENGGAGGDGGGLLPHERFDVAYAYDAAKFKNVVGVPDGTLVATLVLPVVNADVSCATVKHGF